MTRAYLSTRGDGAVVVRQRSPSPSRAAQRGGRRARAPAGARRAPRRCRPAPRPRARPACRRARAGTPRPSSGGGELVVAGAGDSGRATARPRCGRATSSKRTRSPSLNGRTPSTCSSGAVGGEVAGGGARKYTTAGREDRVRLVGDRFHDDFAADAVCLADPPDDDELGRRHGRGRGSYASSFLSPHAGRRAPGASRRGGSRGAA